MPYKACNPTSDGEKIPVTRSARELIAQTWYSPMRAGLLLRLFVQRGDVFRQLVDLDL